MKIQIITLILALGSWTVFAQHDHAKKSDDKMEQSMIMFKDAKLGTAYEHYVHLKDALVASKLDEAKKGANELKFSLKDVSGATATIELASKLANASNLEEQRKIFSTLSNEMTTLVKSGKLSMGMLYLEYCPMANNNTGAYWLSSEKEIKNPYFGEKMLTCGSIKEMIH